MVKTIQAIYENGFLRPLEKLNIPEHTKIKIIIPEDDIPSALIAKVADQSGSYNFLKDSNEDIYTMNDGEEV